MVAHFVTAIATVAKLDICVALGDLYFETKLLPHKIPGLATRGRYVKTQNFCPVGLMLISPYKILLLLFSTGEELF